MSTFRSDLLTKINQLLCKMDIIKFPVIRPYRKANTKVLKESYMMKAPKTDVFQKWLDSIKNSELEYTS